MSEEKKVKKSATVRRPKFADEKYLGSEPTVTALASEVDMAHAYSWYNYFYTSEDALKFTLSYLKSIKYDKDTITKIGNIRAPEFTNWVGWNCRLLAQGSTLSEGVWEKTIEQLQSFTSEFGEVDEGDSGSGPVPKVISIAERVNRKASECIGELEEQLDVFFKEGIVQFDVKKWSLEKAIKPQIGKKIADHFRPQYEEIMEAIAGKDKELVEAYKGWRKPVLKIMAIFIKRIVDHMTEIDAATVSVRKPRKKKVKPASQLVAKMNYCKSADTLTSINPPEIIGAMQLWTYNHKTRNLSVYNAVGNSGFSVRGTTLTGFDETSSVTKKLRKPEQVLPRVLNEGKVGLRKVMPDLTTTEQKATGRINAETILLRVVK